jgi:hypothetical protein
MTNHLQMTIFFRIFVLMDNEFTTFIEKAKRYGLCAEYTAKVDNAQSKKQVVDIAFDANGISWLCDSIAKGWGLSPDYISEHYTNFLNGLYVYHGNGYTSAMYCQVPTVRVCTTLACVIDCQSEIHADRICELHIVNSNVKITGEGRCVVHLYNSHITNADSFNGIVVKDNTY